MEVQVLKIGWSAILGLPGEPFTSLGRQIRSRSSVRYLLIAGAANDYGPISYIADRAAYALGGYELIITSVAVGAGEILVEQAAVLLGL